MPPQTEGEKQRKVIFAEKAPKPIGIPRKPKFELLDLHHVEVARQLTLLDHHYYKAISPAECLAWGNLGKNERHKARNIDTVVKRFNAVSIIYYFYFLFIC